jgi:hypothetical protein
MVGEIVDFPGLEGVALAIAIGLIKGILGEFDFHGCLANGRMKAAGITARGAKYAWL